MNNKHVSVEVEDEIDLLLEAAGQAVLTLHNDDYNTFEHVIVCLVTYCEHEFVQAEQVAMIVHTKGKCDIKRGNYDYIHKLYKLLQNEGLTVTIDMDV